MIVSVNGLLIAFELEEDIPPGNVGNCIVGIKGNGVLTGVQGLLVASQFLKGNAHVVVGDGIVGVKADDVVTNGEGLLIASEFHNEDIAAFPVGSYVVAVKSGSVLVSGEGLLIAFELTEGHTARPKSASKASPLPLKRILSGLRSRCTTLCR